MASKIIFSNQVGENIDLLINELTPSSVVVLVDENTATYVLPQLCRESVTIANASAIITVKAGEQHKNIESLTEIWQQLGDAEATRKSLLINIGGGVITDMGGFAASTFKRGIRFVNVPTTLLSAVDASVGGKTGINFNSLKNEVGVIREPDGVIISTEFFSTLAHEDMLSGYAEMIKHGFLTSSQMAETLLNYDITQYTPHTLLEMLRDSVEVKRKVVERDLNDMGIRKTLNLGHTSAHAFESLAMQRDTTLPHGYAVAFGLLVTLILSRINEGFPSQQLHRYATYVKSHYGTFEFTCDDYPSLLRFMHHDKKNATTKSIACVLLRDYGDAVIDAPVSDDDMMAALDIYRDMLNLP